MIKSTYFFTYFIVFVVSVHAFASDIVQKTRVIILTDIENEPDDAQSLIRFLTYSNQFDIEGIIATTSYWQQNKLGEWRLREIANAFGKVRDNLLLHEKGFPTAEYVQSKISHGLPVYGMEGVGKDKNSDGSELIVKSITNNDSRPLWILAWGGTNCLAQALWKLQEEMTSEVLSNYIQNLRVYAISDQDDSGPWIRQRFPSLFYIVSPGYAHNGREGYHFATWTGISGDTFHGRFVGANREVISDNWIRNNIQENHGALGEEYPNVKYLMEGDSPSFLYLLHNGLGSSENPNYGSWGGRYEYYVPRTKNYFFHDETHPIWTNADDEVPMVGVDGYATSDKATIWRWREHFQNDFAARMDWCVKSFDEANHPPEPVLSHDAIIKAQKGETITLDASRSTDPDGDSLSYNWIYYREAGNSVYWITLNNSDSSVASFIVPEFDKPQQIHIILVVTDSGSPALTRYKRVIVEIEE